MGTTLEQRISELYRSVEDVRRGIERNEINTPAQFHRACMSWEQALQPMVTDVRERRDENWDHLDEMLAGRLERLLSMKTEQPDDTITTGQRVRKFMCQGCQQKSEIHDTPDNELPAPSWCFACGGLDMIQIID